jgi:hypothetical protein
MPICAVVGGLKLESRTFILRADGDGDGDGDVEL